MIDEWGFPWWLSGKEPVCQCRRRGFDPWAVKITWRRKWQPTPVFLSGKSYGQGSLVGCSPWGCKRVWHDSTINNSIRITVWGSAFTGVQNDTGLLSSLEALGCWRLCMGRRRFVIIGNLGKTPVNREKNELSIFVLLFYLSVFHLSDWIMTSAELAYLWF